MQTLIITGAAGFIGSNFVRYMLARYPGYKLIALDALTYAGNLDNLADVADNPRFQFVEGDITNPEAVAKAAESADAIINFAAESHVDRSILNPGAFIQTDVAGVWTLLESARVNKHARFLHVSTDEVYGSANGVTFPENAPLLPNSPYSASKAGGEMMVRAYHVTHGLPTIVTRGSNTFGPYQYPEKMMPLFITNLIDNQPVPVYGNGMQVRDWMYVTDHCQGIDIALHHGTPGEAYNVGGGNERPNMAVTRAIMEQLDKPDSLIHHVKDRPGHDVRYSIDCAKLEKLGFKPEMPFEDRLQETVQWYIDNEAWWRAIKEKQQSYQEFMKNWYADRK